MDFCLCIKSVNLILNHPDFFAVIRTIHNDRAQNPDYQRLTFVLLGVATPDELISDRQRTPFNIGHAIDMRDFSYDECKPLQSAIEARHPIKAESYFQQIYEWANGHPYLTQRLCKATIETPQTDDPHLVKKLVDEIFLGENENLEPNLYFVQTRILSDPLAPRMLRLYSALLQYGTIPDDPESLTINRLKLYGLIVSVDPNFRF
ncbi:AAA-like domain-containing protein [Chloroflexi bacterium TSY]|nr:AAA-like domain-containing protein [Chloroflexi bacterium TSY]